MPIICQLCNGTGCCPACDGRAITQDDRRQWHVCSTCHGTGDCPECAEQCELDYFDRGDQRSSA